MNLAAEIKNYWNGRATSYSNGVKGELGDGRRDLWENELDEASHDIFDSARSENRAPRVLDLGCGPGFFSVLFADRACAVDAVDLSDEMLDRARANVSAQVPNADVTFHESDLLALPFDDDAFDLAVARNVTWLMRNPAAAYAEWLRVLRPGGKLVVFDANWYRYLVDPAVAAARQVDQEGNVLEGWDEDAQATSDEEKHCEKIATELPLTNALRPAWDLETLAQLNVTQVFADENAWERLWTDNEQTYYRSTPMFKVEVVK